VRARNDRRGEPEARPWTRRRFLAVAGGGALGALLAACGTPQRTASSASPVRSRFRSRPDLEPPVVEVTGPVGLPGAGEIFLTPGAPLIVDDHGSPVWYHPVPHAATNLRVQHYGGRPVLTWWEGEITHYGVGQRGEVVIVDANYHEIRRVHGADGLVADLHEFVIAADGTGYLTAYRELIADLSAVGGPSRGRLLDSVVQGIDLATGAAVFEWHSADHIELSETYQRYSAQSAAPLNPCTSTRST